MSDGKRYRLRFYSYAGIAYDVIEDDTLAECRDRAARWIRWHRNALEYPVSILKRGFKWEFQTGDDAAMVGDGEGVLTIVENKVSFEPDGRTTQRKSETTLKATETPIKPRFVGSKRKSTN